MIDYKKIIKNRDTRARILRLLSFVPDKQMICLQYRIKTGRKLNLKNPQRYTEKMQWLKLFYRNPLYITCTDKYDVREYVKGIGFGRYLVENYGVYDRFEDIDFSTLPNKFVLKDTLGSAGCQVVLVQDKDKLNFGTLKETCDKWTNTPVGIRDDGREWAYQVGKAHRIIIDELLEADKEIGGLIDYKFLCFNGKCKYLYIAADRTLGNGAGFGIFDNKFVRINCNREDERVLARDIKKPDNFEEMLELAEELAKAFPYARIDLYNTNGNIRLGEISFYDGSGYMTFDRDEFDIELGNELILPDKMI